MGSRSRTRATTRRTKTTRTRRSRPRRRPLQLALRRTAGHGGRRAGAGRKPVRGKPGVSHHGRPEHVARHPVHVTMRTVKGVTKLRQRRVARAIQASMARATKDKFRVVHYTIMDNHIHMIVEADDRKALSRGMQGLNSGIARKVNRLLGRRGQSLWRDRYHEEVLKTPQQVRNALLYVLNNARRHMRGTSRRMVRGWVDDRSTAVWFRGWTQGSFEGAARGPAPPGARTWLLRVGWKRAGGLLDLEAVPGAG